MHSCAQYGGQVLKLTDTGVCLFFRLSNGRLNCFHLWVNSTSITIIDLSVPMTNDLRQRRFFSFLFLLKKNWASLQFVPFTAQHCLRRMMKACHCGTRVSRWLSLRWISLTDENSLGARRRGKNRNIVSLPRKPWTFSRKRGSTTFVFGCHRLDWNFTTPSAIFV